jgi:hypothetical protein
MDKPIGIAFGGMTEKENRFWFDRGVDFISSSSDIGAMVAKVKETYQNMKAALSVRAKEK